MEEYGLCLAGFFFFLFMFGSDFLFFFAGVYFLCHRIVIEFKKF